MFFEKKDIIMLVNSIATSCELYLLYGGIAYTSNMVNL